MSTRVIAAYALACVAPLVAFAERIPPMPETTYDIIDDFSHPEPATVWKPMAGSKPVSLVKIGGRTALRMRCNFQGTRMDRASWDHEVKLDLVMCRGLQFLFFCPNASPVAHFTVYLHSGDGWYRVPFDAPASAAWSIITIDKNAANVEGRPAGWDEVDTIRISAWRGQDTDTEFYIAAMGTFGTGGQIMVVRGDSAAAQAPNELESVRRYAGVMSELLDRAGLSHVVLSDLNVTSERLRDIKLIVLPHNPTTPETLTGELVRFLGASGKLVACYNLPASLEASVGIRTGSRISQEYQGHFASIRPSHDGLQGMPAITEQASWNVREASAVEGRSRVAAWWFSDNGQPTGKPAIIASHNCVFVTHVLLSDDPSGKLHLLLAMVGNLVPDLWREAAQSCLDRVGHLGPYDSFGAAKEGITEAASGDSRVLRILETADRLHSQALAMLSEGKYSQAIVAAEESHRSLIDAYCVAQKPLSGEHRAFWCHSAFGVAGMSWDRAVQLLAENGFTAILPNMLWGGVAFYASDVLPVAPAVEEEGDQIDLCVAACRKYGVQCHIWKVNYNMGWAADKTFMAKMKTQGRTQVGYDGSSNDRWLCPSHPENQKLEIDAMLEVARNYGVDGLHFDYIRYPGSESCFCEGCRLRFEKVAGRRLTNWPNCVRNDDSLREKWLDFRRQQITGVVTAVAEEARKIRPDIKISAAVFRDWPVDRNTVGQDWKLWCDRGYLDFVCPMDYTASSSHFERMIEQQLTWAGKVPCYPGIGLSVWSDSADICKLIEQINITRRLATGGFTVFNYGPTQANEVLPLLGKGITRKR